MAAQSKLKVMIVDDDPVQLMVMASWLEDDGYAVTTHNSPMGTTQLVLAYRPDVIVLDVEMPLFSGPALLETIKKNAREFVPAVIFMSSKAQLKAVPVGPPVLGKLEKTANAAQFVANFRTLTRTVRPTSPLS